MAVGLKPKKPTIVVYDDQTVEFDGHVLALAGPPKLELRCAGGFAERLRITIDCTEVPALKYGPRPTKPKRTWARDMGLRKPRR